MRGRTHATVAATLGLGLGLALQQSGNGWLAGTALAGLGGLLPDIDEPQSMIGHSPRMIARGATGKSRHGSLPRLALLATGELLTGLVQTLATVVRELTGHRGATHWLLAALRPTEHRGGLCRAKDHAQWVNPFSTIRDD